ncbi:MAG TPA: oxidoreductase [Pseudomonadales bacterium]|nr:oxidoreductase [Pseudomonadales bacterium]
MNGAGRTAAIIGATGLIGNLLLDLLLTNPNYSTVTAITRRPLEKKHPKLVNLVVDFERLEEIASEIQGHDAFCCLGTTIKAAGSRAAFRRVDYDYAVNFATACKSNGCTHFLLISAVGAHHDSYIFYNRTKGELEQALGVIGFPVLTIFQPSLLVGDRKEHRLGEELAIRFSALMSLISVGPFKQYHPVKAEMLAKAMINCALDTPEPHGQTQRRFTFKHIKKLAGG